MFIVDWFIIIWLGMALWEAIKPKEPRIGGEL